MKQYEKVECKVSIIFNKKTLKMRKRDCAGYLAELLGEFCVIKIFVFVEKLLFI